MDKMVAVLGAYGLSYSAGRTSEQYQLTPEIDLLVKYECEDEDAAATAQQFKWAKTAPGRSAGGVAGGVSAWKAAASEALRSGQSRPAGTAPLVEQSLRVMAARQVHMDSLRHQVFDRTSTFYF